MDDIETIIETREGTIKIIKFNRPFKKNAIDHKMYVRVTKILNETANDDNITITVITGAGDYYSSGNDLIASLETPRNDQLSSISAFIKAFVKFPKLLVAIVNGPAIGIAATTLALCDLVFASENSYFYTPFTKLGFVAEGCSTLTFPRLIGDRKAAEMLLYNHKMSAEEALRCGFINYLYKPEEIQSTVWNKIVEVSKLPKQSVSTTKMLLKQHYHDELLKTNDKEMEELNKVWSSGETADGLSDFFSRKSKI